MTCAERDQAVSADVGTQLFKGAMRAVVESERRRLSKAEAILTSLCFALDHADNIEVDGTHLSLVAESARDLIATALERLDSARLAEFQQ